MVRKAKPASYYDQSYFDGTSEEKGYPGPYSFASAPWERLARSIVRTFGCHLGAKSLVDFGCAHGYTIWYLQNVFGWEVKGYDFSEYVMDNTAPGIPVECVDITKKYPFWQADIGLCMDTLEHIEEGKKLEQALSNLHDASRMATILHVYVTDGAETSTRPLPEHITIHNRAWWKDLFLANGFRTHVLEPYYKTTIRKLAKGQMGKIWAEDSFVLEPLAYITYPIPVETFATASIYQEGSYVTTPPELEVLPCEMPIAT